MRFRLLRPRAVSDNLRDLARQTPDAAEEYLEAHPDEWETLAEDAPENAADILEAIDEVPAAELLRDLETEEAADVLDEMRPEPAADVIEQLTPAAAAKLIEAMEPDQAADVVGSLDEETRAAVVAALDPDTTHELADLLRYPADSAGGLMTRDIAALPVGITAGEAVDRLRAFHDDLGANMTYVYVVDDEERLLGVVSFRDLFFARPGQGIDEVMVHNPVAVRVEADREVVSELIQRFHLIALPVTDAEGRLIGIVKVSEALEAVQAEATEDIAVMVGAGIEETVYSPVLQSARRRLPWIVVNLVIGFGIASVIFQFEDTIAGNARLAAYMPMVALLAGNSGAQSLAVIIRSMALGDLPRGRAPRAVRREFILGVVNGLVIAVLGGLGGALLSGSGDIGVVIAVAVAVNFLVAGLAGAGVPVVLRRLGQDPALASNIFLTMITDIVGFGGFLLTASLLL
ncbi:MAG: magnesium transporter [Acidimicrobiia bacterium]